MGNAVPRNMRHEATSGVPSSGRASSAARRHARKVARAAVGRRGAEGQQAGGGGGSGSTVVMTVKVVVTRKEARKLIARLEEQSARARKARIAELTGQLRAGDGGGGRSPLTCGAARAPRLAAIQES